MGVGAKIPRTIAVFARKRRRKYAEQEYADHRDINDIEATWRDNYKSVQLHVDEVEAQLEDLVRRQLAFKLTPQEAEGRFPRLQVVSMGAVEKAVEPPKKPTVRLVMDGSNGVQVNKRIKPRDQARSPTATDIKWQQREMGLTRPGAGWWPTFAKPTSCPESTPTISNTNALEHDRAAMSYVHTVGIFGVTSIAYWWARLGGAALRCTIYLAALDWELWTMMRADDLKIESTAVRAKFAILWALCFLGVLGVPVSWEKVHGGSDLKWIGFHVDVPRLTLGITESRAAWLVTWTRRLARDGTVDLDEFRGGVGRLSFVTGALEYEKPFLAPLFAFLALHPGKGRRFIPMYVALVLEYLAGRFELRRHYPSAVRREKLEEAFRADARATEETIGIGGWLPTRGADGKLNRWASPWYAIELNELTAPWAYSRGLPFRTIAALEALGALISVMAFGGAESAGTDASLKLVGGLTDNSGNRYALTRLMSSKFPLCGVVMEMAAQLERRGMRLTLDWCRREDNQDADDLSNGDTKNFNPERPSICRHVRPISFLPYSVRGEGAK